MKIFDWVGDLVSKACHHEVWNRPSLWPARNWFVFESSLTPSTITSASFDDGYRFAQPNLFNPASGLPKDGIAGTVFGPSLSQWSQHHSSYSLHDSLNIFTSPACHAPGYDPVRGW